MQLGRRGLGGPAAEAQAAEHTHLHGDRLAIFENKSDRPHWVHLPKLALDLLADHAGHLFEQRSPTAIQSRLKRAGTGWTPHDLRRTFATKLSGLKVDGLNVAPPHVVEKMLNHSLGGVMAIYNRHGYEAERVAAAEAWAVEVERIVKVAKSDV